MLVCGFPSESSSNPPHWARGAGRGQEARLIHAPRPLQGGRWLFKRVFRGEDSLQKMSPSASGTPFLSCSNCKLSPLPTDHSLTLDVSKIPNALPILPSIASNGKEKTRGHKRRPVTHTLTSAGDVAGTPAALRVPLGLHLRPNPTSAQLRSTPSPAQRIVGLNLGF